MPRKRTEIHAITIVAMAPTSKEWVPTPLAAAGLAEVGGPTLAPGDIDPGAAAGLAIRKNSVIIDVKSVSTADAVASDADVIVA